MKPEQRGVSVDTDSLGEAWLAIAKCILESGRASKYDGLEILELVQVTLEVNQPDPDDALITRYADPERLAWMRTNFRDKAKVAALGNAESYASRLFDYGRSGLDQLDWVTERLANDPSSRSATITMLEPLTDTSYIPCVSMLDFWIPDEALDLVVYCHSIDFGAKGYGNLVELAALQERVATSLNRTLGRLTMIVKSAHIYATEFELMQSVLAESSNALPSFRR